MIHSITDPKNFISNKRRKYEIAAVSLTGVSKLAFQYYMDVPKWKLAYIILYPIWGVIQQFLVIGLVAGNLQDLKRTRLNEFVIIVLTALLFGLIHYPYYWLMLGTFILALLYGFIYLRERNIYVMGLFHGWLGGLFFIQYWIEILLSKFSENYCVSFCLGELVRH